MTMKPLLGFYYRPEHWSGLLKGLPKHTAYCFAFGCHLPKVESTSEHDPETPKMGLVWTPHPWGLAFIELGQQLWATTMTESFLLSFPAWRMRSKTGNWVQILPSLLSGEFLLYPLVSLLIKWLLNSTNLINNVSHKIHKC